MLAEGDRKSLQPVVARQGGTLAAYESLQQFIADSPWDPAGVMRAVAERICPQIDVRAWILDDTGYPKQGTQSPGVKRQYSGTLGKTGNCQIGVSVHAAGSSGTVPLGWSLYLPQDWCADTDDARERRRKAKIPDGEDFQTKPQRALALVQAAASWQIMHAPILGDAAYGINTEMRTGLDDAGLTYVLSIDAQITIYDPDTEFAVPERTNVKGPAPSKPVADRSARSVGELVADLDADAFEELVFRDGIGADADPLVSRFACLRVIVAHPVMRNGCEPREEWLIVEWPEGHDQPLDYWLSNLPADTHAEELARLARLRWMIELDYKQLKGHLGLDHYEGRSWLGWHHHAALVTIAHGWLTEQRRNPFHPRPD
jgi:SRSO17 transposase